MADSIFKQIGSVVASAIEAAKVVIRTESDDKYMTGKKTVSTEEPSGGVDGDIWIQV